MLPADALNGIFQGYYVFHHLGMNRGAREEFRAHPWLDRTARVGELYDGPAFDPKGEMLPLEHFEPVVRRVMAVAMPHRSESGRGQPLPRVRRSARAIGR